MADNTISTSRQSSKPDCNQLNIIDQPIMNKYTEIDESPSTDTEEPMSVASNAMKLQMNATLTKMIQNKLKRKKKLSNSLTSVGDAVNQEKRTRIEGIQLNCRGKLNEELLAAAAASSPSSLSNGAVHQQVRLERVQTRASQPSPKVAEKIIMLQQSQQQQQQHQSSAQQSQMAKVPPPRLKRKLEENVSTIQKLNAQTEQMRLEIGELKTHLSTERSAVRVLRAQNESETRKWKNEIKKLQTAMELMRKVKKSKEEACANWTNNTCSSANGAKDANITNHELQRLTNELSTLREANRNLEEKLQISNDAERRKAADLRELKDSYEIRLTQLSKSAKTEISRLLEEIKTKERNIGQLKKETQTLQKLKTNKTTNHNKKDNTHPRNVAQNPSEMKRLKDNERNRNSNNNCNITNKNQTNTEKCFINTTCGEKEFHSMPHEFTERILEAHNDVHAYRSKQDHQNSDSDSALSSAPPSISPQPPPTGMEPADIWQTIRNYTKDIEKVQNELDSIQKENEALQKELNLAKQQILESEKTALEATNNAKIQQQLLDRIKYLEQKESELQEETHELREQNELLEFRILELEESNDKWSLQSNTTPNSKNVWNDGGKESDDAIIFTDRSDSGVTSPHSHHHIDDRINVISPCDLNLLDHMTNDDLRRRLSQMIKKSNIDEDDKMCLQQVLVFIQNLDVMSHDSLPSSEESSSLEYIKSRVSDYGSSSRSSDVSPTQLLQKPKSAPSTGRIVATVLPYSSSVSTPNESPQRKLRAWHTSSLTESGVFEGDLSESSVYTQTEPEDFACLESASTKELCSEIQKLNRFRQKFEECVAKSAAHAKVPAPSPSLSLSDQKRIQYYKDRLEVLESKLLIYESSGDLQAKRLADRLQREIQLENLVKELRDRVDFLEVENASLEEEKCEFEEAENDTRLRLQRLEVELEILSQRNIELEMSREALQNKLKDCRSESAILREDLAACQTQICNLDEDRCRYKEDFEFLHSCLPALVLYNVFFVTINGMGNILQRDDNQTITENEEIAGSSNNCQCAQAEDKFRWESHNLRDEVRGLRRQIDDLNSRHAEAMSCADGCWEDLERDYKEQLLAYEAKEASLKQKIKQLEGCLKEDSRAANEKICQLEDSERELRLCLQKVSRDYRELLKEHDFLTGEYQRMREKFDTLKEQIDGPVKEAMERDKAQIKNLKEELGYMRRTNCEQEMHYRNELDCFQVQLDKVHKELLQIQVTNSELREEVCTLEKQVVTLQEEKKEDVDKIRCLSDEVRTKEDMCAVFEKRIEALLSSPYFTQRQPRCGSRLMSASCSEAVPSLAQELNGSPVKRQKRDEPADLYTAAKNLGCVLDKNIPTHKQFQNVANDVKKLADSILASKSNGEVSQETKKRPTEDDRYGDHSNLGFKPNNEASAGPIQQPAGLRELHQTKEDKGDDKHDEQTSTEQYFTPRGQQICPFEHSADNCCQVCSRWAAKDDTKPNMNLDSSVKTQIFFTKKLGEKGNVSVEEEEIRVNQTTEKITVTRNYFTVNGPQHEPHEQQTIGFVDVGPMPGILEKSAENSTLIGSSEKPGSDNKMQNSQPDMGSKLVDLKRVHESSAEEQWYSPIQSINDMCCCSGNQKPEVVKTSSTTKESTDEKLLPLLQNIFEVLQTMRDQQLQGFSIPSESAKQPQKKESFMVVPATPPTTPASSYNNVMSDPTSIHAADKLHGIEYELPEPPDLPDLPDIALPYMEVFEPPERDFDDQQSFTDPKKKVIPVDMELLRSDAIYEWEPEPPKSVECQVNAGSLMDISFDGNDKTSREVQVNRSSLIGSDHTQESLEHGNGPADDNPKQVSSNNGFEAEQKGASRGSKEKLDQGSESGSNGDLSGNLHRSISDYGKMAEKENLPPPKDACECICKDPLKCADTCCRKQAMQKSDRFNRNDRSYKGVQVDAEPIASVTRIQDSSLSPRNSTNLPTDIPSNENPSQGRTSLSPETKIHDSSLSPRNAKNVPTKTPSKENPSQDRISLSLSQIESAVAKEKEVLMDVEDLQGSTSAANPPANVPPLQNMKPITPIDGAPSTTPNVDTKTLDSNRSCGPCGQGSPRSLDPETANFINSLMFDLEAMKAVRENAYKRQRLVKLPTNAPGEWQKPSAELSYPVTIEKVKELGENSLFVKWIVHNKANIAGYEIFLDGHLTNQYYNAVHRAAVICEVNLQCPHRVVLRAKPQFPTKLPACCTKATNPEELSRQPDGSTWRPSIYHFEPSFYPAPAKSQLENGSAVLLNASQD